MNRHSLRGAAWTSAKRKSRSCCAQSVAKLAAGFGHQYYVERARSGRKATELWRAVAEHGFVGVNLPEEHGGGGQGMTELAIVAEELAVAGCPLLLLVVSPAIAGTVIARFGDAEQQAKWLPGIAAGRSIFAFAITEPDAGSNSHNLSTTATRDGDEYRLVGHEALHLRRRRGRPHPGGDPHRRRRGLRSRALVAVRGAHRRRRTASRSHRRRDPGSGDAVHPVLRRRARPRRQPDRHRGRGVATDLRRAQPRADHGRGRRDRRRPLRPVQGGRLRPRPFGVGRPDRHPPGHRPSPWRRPRSTSSCPA